MSLEQSQSTERRRCQFTLRTLVLLLTWTAVCLGLSRWAVAVGAAFGVASLPALVRTHRVMAEGMTVGRPTSLMGVVGTFLESLLIVALIAVAWVSTALCVSFAGIFLGVRVLAAAGQLLAKSSWWVFAVTGWLETRVLRTIGRFRRINGYLSRRFRLQST
jgi:hypothetical protein